MLDNGQGNTTIGRIKVATKTTLNGTELTAANLQAGELATAIGSRTDLTSITVTSGTLNGTDWAAILQSKAALLYLNLEGATYNTETGGAELAYTNLSDVIAGNSLPLKEVKLPQGITGLGVSAFHNCSDLASITLPDELTSIGTNVFYKCSALTDINLPEGLQIIKNYTFYGCSSLTTVTCLAAVPPTLETIAFYGCNTLTAIYVPATSVETYKSNWSQYADKIKEISEGI